MKIHIIQNNRSLASQINAYIDADVDILVCLDDERVCTAGLLEHIDQVMQKNEHHAIVGVSYLHDPECTSGFVYDDHYIFPVVRESFFALKMSVFRNMGGFDENIIGVRECLAEYGFRINAYGYNTILARFFTNDLQLAKRYSRLTHAQMRGLAHVHENADDIIRQFLQFKIDPAIHFDLFLKNDSDKKRILFSLQNSTATFNGTTEYSVSLLRSFVHNFGDRYDVDVLVARDVYEFYGLSSMEHMGVYFLDQDEERLPLYHMIFSPSQVFDMRYIRLFNKISPRIVVSVLDAILWRSGYLDVAHTGGYTSCIGAFLMRHGNGMLFISKTAHDDVKDFFHLIKNDRLHTCVTYLAQGKIKNDHDNIVITEKYKHILEKKYVLIIGNKFKHKSVSEAHDNLKDLDVSQVYIGCENDELKRDHIYFFNGGDIPEHVMQKLYQNAHLIVFPSQYEGFGLPILKAIEYNKKIILFKNQINQEVVGQFVQDREQSVFFEQFAQLSGLVTEHMSDYAVKSFLDRSWHDVAAETELFFHKIIEAPVDTEYLRERWMHVVLCDVPKVAKNDREKFQRKSGNFLEKIVFYKKKFFARRWM